MSAHKKSASSDEVLHLVLRHPLRKLLLKLFVEAEAALSPKELTLLANDPSIANVGYHVRSLAEHGAVELVEMKPRRGSVEHFYKATSLVDEVPWGRTALGLGGDTA